MSYSIKQSSKYIDNNRWQWQAWIDATDNELVQINDVVWYLHDTFPKPVIRKTNRTKKFLIKQTGWGVFTLYADVNLKNKEVKSLSHQLTFESAEKHDVPLRGAQKNLEEKQTKVFLSYGAEDAELAQKVSKNLQGFGYTVLDANNTETGMPYKLAQQKLLRESDMIMGLVTSDVASPFVLNDLNNASQSNKEAVALIGKDVKPLGLDPNLKQFSLTMESDDTQLENLFTRKGKL